MRFEQSPRPRSSGRNGVVWRASRLVVGALLLIGSTGCSTKTPPPRPVDTTAPGFLMGPEQTQPGAPVLIERRGQWLPGVIVSSTASDRFRIRYDGFGPEWEEEVGPERMRPVPGATPAAGANPASLPAGTPVLVYQQGRWLLARTQVGASEGAVRVQYDGFEPAFVEDIAPNQIRMPYAGQTVYPVGESVAVRAGETTVPGTVLAAVTDGSWLVRFVGYGPEHDRIVGSDEIVGGATPGTPIPPTLVVPESSGKSAGSASPPAQAFSVGDDVLVRMMGIYHPASVTGISGSTVEVKYTGAAELDGAESSSGPGASVARSEVSPWPEELAAGAAYSPKDDVFVEWHGVWVRGSILKKTGPSQYQVRFSGFGPDRDEIVQKKRLLPRN